MRNLILYIVLIINPALVFCQKIELASVLDSPLKVISNNDNPNPVVIRADGKNSSLASVVINATQSSATPFFGLLRSSSLIATLSTYQTSVFGVKLGASNFNALNIAVANNNVGLNMAVSNIPAASFEALENIKLGTNGTVLTSLSLGSAQYNLPSIIGGQTAVFTLGIFGSKVGSSLNVTPELALDSRLVIAYIRGKGLSEVEIGITNVSNVAIDPPNMNWYVRVIN